MKNKNIIVTGGASGIGLAITKRFASAGGRVFIFDIDEETGTEAALKLQAEGLPVGFVQCDISDYQEVTEAVARVKSPIHILVNNAGVAHIGNLEKTTEEDLDRLYQINIKGVYNCSKALIGQMVEQGGGVILNMASIAAVVGIPDRFAYSMTKAAVLNMTLTIARDYIDKNIRCNAISPARIHTPFVDGFLAKHYPGQEEEMFAKLAATQPIGRMGTPEEVAALAMYLCSEEAAFVTGCNFPLDGGFINLK
ncbi:MAG: SDR family oxidoreductase [Saprospiraceae bacterium]|jgi:NAD(P)-dependent dehydrogenase (short-subunit alcohol dehydrogenase family)|nr:SDR family oxidoreductase [Saprospiraceae bacterium]